MKNPFLAFVCSLMLPGLGQIYLKDYAKGWTFLCMTAGVGISLIVSHSVIARFLAGGIYLAVMFPAAIDAFQTATGRTRVFSVPVSSNFRESEIGAVQAAMHDKKIKTWAGDTVSYVIVMLLLVGPFAMPLLWQSRKFSHRAKIIWTLAVMAVALLSVAVLTVAASFLDPFMKQGSSI